jgi:hypothetical protein
LSGATATEVIQNNQQVYNTLYSYSTHRAKITKFQLNTIAHFADVHVGLSVDRKYPSNLNRETVQELLQLRASPGAPNWFVNEIDKIILQKQNADDPRNLERVKMIQNIRPYADRTESERMSSLMAIPELDPKRILYYYFDDIINDLDADAAYKDWFYKPLAEVRNILERLIMIYTKRYTLLKAKASPSLSFGSLEDNDEEEEEEL